ncbi:CU044_5270 family protein [Streptomyces sp. NPDC002787]
MNDNPSPQDTPPTGATPPSEGTLPSEGVASAGGAPSAEGALSVEGGPSAEGTPPGEEAAPCGGTPSADGAPSVEGVVASEGVTSAGGTPSVGGDTSAESGVSVRDVASADGTSAVEGVVPAESGALAGSVASAEGEPSSVGAPSGERVVSAGSVPSAGDIPPAVEREFAPERHRLLREHLMREIESRAEDAKGVLGGGGVTAPRKAGGSRSADGPEVPGGPQAPGGTGAAGRPSFWRRTAFVAPLVAAGLTVAVVVGGAVTRQAAGPGRPEAGQATSGRSASDWLERIARAAEKRPGPGEVRDDQFVYVKSTDDYVDATTGDECVPQKTSLNESETWASVDGTRPGLRRISEDGKEVYQEPQDPRANAGARAPHTYRELADLPTDADTMYAWLHKGSNARQPTADSAFATASDILSDNLVPPDVAAALFRAVAKLPGVTTAREVRDAVGRTGIAIGRTPTEPGLERIEWIFDVKTLEYLGERELYTASLQPGLSTCPPTEKGTVVTSKAITEVAVVDKAGQLP